MKRKSPLQHVVQKHQRKGKTVRAYFRGHGNYSGKKLRLAEPTIKKTYRMQDLDKLIQKVIQTKDHLELTELRRRVHDIWYEERNYGTYKENEKRAREVYNRINQKIDANLQLETGEIDREDYYRIIEELNQILRNV